MGPNWVQNTSAVGYTAALKPPRKCLFPLRMCTDVPGVRVVPMTPKPGVAGSIPAGPVGITTTCARGHSPSRSFLCPT